MKLIVTPKRDTWLLVEMQRNNGTSTLYTIEDYQGFKPSFKTDDIWLAELDEDNGSVIEPVKIWINPEDGVIWVTMLGRPKRQPFSSVKRWLIQIATQHDHPLQA